MKGILAAAAVSVYFLCPAYRYYVIGTWIGLKILDNKPKRVHVIRKGSRLYADLRRRERCGKPCSKRF